MKALHCVSPRCNSSWVMSKIILAQRLNYMVCNAACNLFLNNSEFRVKQILWPQTLPHSPPIFLWVTCGAAGKPKLF